jgi:uncharacterized protein (TIGR03089 family)
VQLAPLRPSGPPPEDLATALRVAAELLGQRPAVTVLHAAGREEQGVASLAQWAAKGAHLLTLDLLLEPGDRLHLDAPPSWQVAAVCLAAWWAGLEVTLDGSDGAAVAVLHESRQASPGADEVLWLGDAVDGGPSGEIAGESWPDAVQTFPDQPPAPRATPTAAALRVGGVSATQAALLRRAAALDGGTAGIEVPEEGPRRPPDARRDEVVAIAVRPLVAHRPTVVLRGVERAAAAGDRVSVWL